MAVVQIDETGSADTARKRSELRFPSNTLADSVMVAKTIHDRGGGKATTHELAAFLNYAGTNNGAFLSRLGAARLFGLVSKEGDRFVPTAIAQNILMPVYDWAPKEALTQAFLNVELFRRVFEEYNGKQLPPEFGLKNALKTIFGVAPNRVERAYRVLIESADTAGFFETRAGARTHLIIPTVNKGQAAAIARDGQPQTALGGSGGGNDGGGSYELLDVQSATAGSFRGAGAASSIQAVKAKYLESLIRLFEEKSGKGELDEALMSRIERLLGYDNP